MELRHLKSPFTLLGDINKCVNTDRMNNPASLPLKSYDIGSCIASPTNPITVPYCCRKIGQHILVLPRAGESLLWTATECGCYVLFGKILMLACLIQLTC